MPPYKGSIGRGIYFADNPQTAAYYGQKVHEVDVDLKNPLIIDACRDGEQINYRNPPEVDEGHYDSILVGENVPPFDVLIGGQWHEIRDGNDLEGIGAIAKTAGHDAVFFSNARYGSSANNEVLIFDPSVITQYHGSRKVAPAWDNLPSWKRQIEDIQWEKQAQTQAPPARGALTNWYQERERQKASYKAKRQEAARLPCAPYQGYLFHGTPLAGAVDMIQNGIHPSDHGELQSPLLSVSVNGEMLHMFSDGEKNTGFVFDVNFAKVVTLDEVHYALAACESGDFIDDLLEKNPGMEERLKQLGYEDRWNRVGMNEGELVGIFPDVDAFILPGFDSTNLRAEAEMAVTERGCEKLEHMIEYVYIRDHEFDAAEGIAKLKEIGKLMESGQTVDQAYAIVIEGAEPPSLPGAPNPNQLEMKMAQSDTPDFEAALKEIDANEKYDEEVGVHYLGEGDERCETGICTSTAKWLAKRLGGEVRGYHTEAGSGRIGEDCFGHDFCLVQNRWIVDWWASRLLESQAVWDLQDPDQQARIKALYGDPSGWEPLTPTVKTAAVVKTEKLGLWLGYVDSQDAVHADRTEILDAEHQGADALRPWRFRYLEGDHHVVWWDDELETEIGQEKAQRVTDFFAARGFVVKRHQAGSSGFEIKTAQSTPPMIIIGVVDPNGYIDSEAVETDGMADTHSSRWDAPHNRRWRWYQSMNVVSWYTMPDEHDRQSVADHLLDRYEIVIRGHKSSTKFIEASAQSELPDLSGPALDQTVYHGSIFTLVDGMFTELDSNYSDWKAVWFTEDWGAAEEFAKTYHPPEAGQYPVVLRCRLRLEKPAYLNFGSAELEDWKDIYGVRDIRELINPLRAAGYDGWVTQGSLGYISYDDLCAFDQSWEIQAAAVLLNNDWSSFMPLDQINDYVRQQTQKPIRSVCSFCKRIINSDHTPGEIAGPVQPEDSHGCCSVCRPLVLDNAMKKSKLVSASTEPDPFEVLTQQMKERDYSYEPAWDPKRETTGALSIGGYRYPTFIAPDAKARIALDSTDLYLYKGSVRVGDPSVRNPKQWTLQGLIVNPEVRGQGVGGQTLQHLQEAADAAGVTLIAEPVQMRQFVARGQQALTTKQLTDWYLRHGWKQREPGSNQILIREPKTVVASLKQRMQKTAGLFDGAAVKVGDRIYGPDPTHYDALWRAADNGAFEPDIHNGSDILPFVEKQPNAFDSLLEKFKAVEGFVKGRQFFNREEAATTVQQAGIQLDSTMLCSEDGDHDPRIMGGNVYASWYKQAQNGLIRYSAKKKTLAVDLDAIKNSKLDKPFKGVKKALLEIRKAGCGIQIYSDKIERYEDRRKIQRWLERHRISYDDLVITGEEPTKDYKPIKFEGEWDAVYMKSQTDSVS